MGPAAWYGVMENLQVDGRATDSELHAYADAELSELPFLFVSLVLSGSLSDLEMSASYCRLGGETRHCECACDKHSMTVSSPSICLIFLRRMENLLSRIDASYPYQTSDEKSYTEARETRVACVCELNHIKHASHVTNPSQSATSNSGPRTDLERSIPFRKASPQAVSNCMSCPTTMLLGLDCEERIALEIRQIVNGHCRERPDISGWRFKPKVWDFHFPSFGSLRSLTRTGKLMRLQQTLSWEDMKLGLKRVSRILQEIEGGHQRFEDPRENFDMQTSCCTWPICPTMRHRDEGVSLSGKCIKGRRKVMRSFIYSLFSLPALISSPFSLTTLIYSLVPPLLPPGPRRSIA